jgi:hypothetical protein
MEATVTSDFQAKNHAIHYVQSFAFDVGHTMQSRNPDHFQLAADNDYEMDGVHQGTAVLLQGNRILFDTAFQNSPRKLTQLEFREIDLLARSNDKKYTVKLPHNYSVEALALTNDGTKIAFAVVEGIDKESRRVKQSLEYALWTCGIDGTHLKRIGGYRVGLTTDGPLEECGLQKLTWLPGNSALSYVLNNNLYVVRSD